MSDTGQGDEREFAEASASLWRITFGPLIWAAHFGLSYAGAAVICAKTGGAAVSGLRLGIGALTLAALVAIAWIGWRAWIQWDMRADRADDPEDRNQWGTSEDRQQFLGHAAFLLAVISFIGVAYVALPAVFIGTCR